MDAILTLHGWIRWGALAAGVIGLFFALRAGYKGDGRGATVPAVIFVAVLDLQLVLGALILALDATARTEGIPHAAVMVAAVATAHVLRVLIKKRGVPGKVLVALQFLAPLVLILVGLRALE